MKEKMQNPENLEEWYARLEESERMALASRIDQFYRVIFELSDAEFATWLEQQQDAIDEAYNVGGQYPRVGQ